MGQTKTNYMPLSVKFDYITVFCHLIIFKYFGYVTVAMLVFVFSEIPSESLLTLGPF